MEELHVPNGTPLRVAVRHAIELAYEENTVFFFEFNGQKVIVNPDSKQEEILEQYYRVKEND